MKHLPANTHELDVLRKVIADIAETQDARPLRCARRIKHNKADTIKAIQLLVDNELLISTEAVNGISELVAQFGEENVNHITTLFTDAYNNPDVLPDLARPTSNPEPVTLTSAIEEILTLAAASRAYLDEIENDPTQQLNDDYKKTIHTLRGEICAFHDTLRILTGEKSTTKIRNMIDSRIKTRKEETA